MLSQHRVICLAILGVCLVGSAAAPVRAGEPEENLSRIKSMTREERLKMVKSLEAFDELDRAKRNEIRELDSQLAALEPRERANYIAVMRRYHVFYKNLPEAKQRQLDQAESIPKKLELITKFRQEAKKPSPMLHKDLVQVSSLSQVRLRGLARDLIVYFNLDPVKEAKERADFSKIKIPQERNKYVRSLIQSKALKERLELREKLTEEDEEFRAAEEMVKKNPALAKRLNQSLKDAAAEIPPKKADARFKGRLEQLGKDAQIRYIISLLDEERVLSELGDQKVDPSNLELFEDALPPWARESMDDLPPDAARRRLRTLYRLVFPAGEEIKPQQAGPPPAPKTQTPPPQTGGSSPF